MTSDDTTLGGSAPEPSRSDRTIVQVARAGDHPDRRLDRDGPAGDVIDAEIVAAATSDADVEEVQHVDVQRVGESSAAVDAFGDFSKSAGQIMGRGKGVFSTTFRWGGLVAILITAVAATWAGDSKPLRTILAATLIVIPLLVIAMILAVRAAWASVTLGPMSVLTAPADQSKEAAIAEAKRTVRGRLIRLSLSAFALAAGWAVIVGALIRSFNR